MVPAHLRNVDFALEKIGAAPLPLDSVLVSFGSWIGGDRDGIINDKSFCFSFRAGNPFVTADLTREVIKLGRWRAAELYYREVDKLLFELSMAHCSEELQRAVDAMPEEVQSTYAVIMNI
jgi:phosphoenolpyruvate carboxylase